MAKETTVPAPTLIAMVVCDSVYKDSGGKRAQIGLFNQITSTEFPATHAPLCVFISLTSVRPQVVCRLEVVHSESDEVVFATQGTIPVNSPTAICDLVFEIPSVTFPEPGRYYVRFSGGGSAIVDRPIELVLVPQPQEEDETNDN